ncbi:MAG TPA: aminodeoxychorismate/anthranilate synthase component II [Anseongella sp.]|nr:aminodeoxychorismate/anthranilate synthase component II [Anseongella sp.]
MVVLYDNYDSFTYNLLDYLLQFGIDVKVVRNDQCSAEEIQAMEPQGILISPGPCRPEKSGGMMELIDRFHGSCPILGICLGHQGLGLYFGADLVRARVPMHGKTSLIRHNDHAAFRGVPAETAVMRYHSLILENVDLKQWQVTATTRSGEIMAMAHRILPLWGFQFHPESVLTGHGFRMIGNWIDNCIIRN